MLSVLCSEGEKASNHRTDLSRDDKSGSARAAVVADALTREIVQVNTEYGRIELKLGILDGRSSTRCRNTIKVNRLQGSTAFRSQRSGDAALGKRECSRLAAAK
jgi:hypothetical protein